MNATVPLPLPVRSPVRRFLDELWRRRFPVAGFVLAVAVLAAGAALLAKPWYTAEATLLPPSEGAGDAFANLAGLIESQALSRVGLFSTQTPADLYVEIVKSRRLREALIRKFDLMRLYDMKGKMDGTLKELNQHLTVESLPTGVVVIRVEDTDKRRCAEMANFLVAELDRFNRETLQTRGKRTRQFLETRLAELDQRLRGAEERLTAYERKHKVVVAADETSVGGMADVMAQKLALQVRRSYLESYTAPGSPSVSEMDAEIQAFDRELVRLPGVKNEGTRLALDAAIQRKLFTFLTAQYEEARVQEMRDTPTVTVLDVARPPDVKSRPKRTVIVLIAAMLATAIACGRVWWTMRHELRA